MEENITDKNVQENKGLKPRGKFAQPEKSFFWLILAIIAVMFGSVVFVIFAIYGPKDNIAMKLFSSFGFYSRNENKDQDDEETNEAGESGVEAEVETSFAYGRKMVFTYEDKLYLADETGSYAQIAGLESAYENENFDMFIPNSYPKFSPDGNNILYTSGEEVVIYNLDSHTESVLYTASTESDDASVYYSPLKRAAWKNEDTIFFVSENVYDNAELLEAQYTVVQMDVDTGSMTDWGTFKMDTGFGGMSSDPSDWLLWHFNDLIGINYEMYWDGTYVYVNTFLGESVWVGIPMGGEAVVVDDSVVLALSNYGKLEMNMDLDSSYESDSFLSDYLLETVSYSPVRLNYFQSELFKNEISLHSDFAHGFWNLWDDEENGYIYFTSIENSDDYASALDSQETYPQDFYPETYIMRINTSSGQVDVVTRGLSFDIY